MSSNIQINGHTYRTLKNPEPVEKEVDNVKWKRTASGGKERAVKIGDSVRVRAYQIWFNTTGASPAEEADFDSLITDLDGYSKTFTFVDHNADSFTARFTAPPARRTDEVGDKTVDIEVIEVLT